MKIKNWQRFQHFRDRCSPPWIKLYRDLLEDPDWHDLDGKTAKTLVMLWMVATEAQGELPSIRKAAFRLRMSEAELVECLAGLTHWIEGIDINAISTRYHGDIATVSEREKEREKETERKDLVGSATAEFAAKRTSEEEKGKARKRKVTYSDAFESFWRPYPRTPVMSKQVAWQAWQRLDEADRQRASAAVPKYSAWLRSKPDHPAVHACRFLSQRRFDGFGVTAEQTEQQRQYLEKLELMRARAAAGEKVTWEQ